jgi:hypothetical protein
MWVAMSAAEREEFLAGVHVGLLSAAIGTARPTLTVPVWYSHQPGGLLTVLTGRCPVRPVRAGRPPYRYVSAEGPVISEEEPRPAERLAMARRCLGAAGGQPVRRRQPGPGRENAASRMRPEHWLSPDQGKRQARVGHPE